MPTRESLEKSNVDVHNGKVRRTVSVAVSKTDGAARHRDQHPTFPPFSK